MTKLEMMLQYIAEHNDFYKKIIRDHGITNPLDITQYPILTRQQLQQNRYNMFSDGYKTKYFDQQLRRQTSSGTSGTPVNVYWDTKDYYLSNKILWKKRFEYYSILPNDRRVMFTLRVYGKKPQNGLPYHVNKSRNLLIINISFLGEETYRDVINLINEFEPKWLYITPSVLKMLLVAYTQLSMIPPASLTYIECVGEVLQNSLREKAKTFFGVQIANMYGSEEVNGIAYECPCGNMHILSDNVYVENGEREYNSGESGAIITSLTNRAMPIIRYNQADLINIESPSAQCGCGCSSPVIGIIKGRVRERIIISTGQQTKLEINTNFFCETMEEVNNLCGDKIIWFNFVYHQSKATLECFVKLNDLQWFTSVKKLIVDTFCLRLGEVNDYIQILVLPVNEPVVFNSKTSIVHVET